MTDASTPDGTLDLADGTDISLEALVSVLGAVPAVDVVQAPTQTALEDEYAPTEGRIGITANDTVHIADGTTWDTVSNRGGIGAVPSDNITAGSFGSTVSLSPGFATFTQVDPDSPSILVLNVAAVTDGSTNGVVSVGVDDSGGTTADYSVFAAVADSGLGSGGQNAGRVTLPLPAGAQFIINNNADPTGSNQIQTVRAQIIAP